MPTLRQPLVDVHEFRQAQTAYTARVFHEKGIDLLHPQLPVFGPDSEVPFEFPLFQAVASVVMTLGLAPDTAVRSTSLLFFLVSGLLLYGLVRELFGRRAAGAAALVFLFSPFAMVWSRAGMIEYLAVAGSLGYFWAGVRWRRLRQWPYAAAAIGSGLVAMLVKPTTGAFWIIPLLVYEAGPRVGGWREWLARRRDPVLGAIVLVPLVAGLAWTRHADAIKAAAPATEWLTSRALEEWNFGTFEQRTTLWTWSTIGGRVQRLLVGVPLWLAAVAVALAFRGSPRKGTLLAVAASAFGTVFVFYNLYVVHDYYLAAVSAQLAILIGVVAAAVVQRGNVRLAFIGALVLVAGLSWRLYDQRGYWETTFERVYDPPTVIPFSQEVAARTSPADRIVLESLDWNPAVPYYAHREVTMLPASRFERLLAALDPDDYDTVVTRYYSADTAALLGKWAWVAHSGPNVFRVAGSFDGLGDRAVVAAADAAAVTVPAGRALLPTPVTLPCGAPGVEVAVGTGSTWLRFDGDRERRIAVGDPNGGGLPADRVFVARPDAAVAGKLRVTCLGEGSVRLLEAVDAPEPGR